MEKNMYLIEFPIGLIRHDLS